MTDSLYQRSLDGRFSVNTFKTGEILLSITEPTSTIHLSFQFSIASASELRDMMTDALAYALSYGPPADSQSTPGPVSEEDDGR